MIACTEQHPAFAHHTLAGEGRKSMPEEGAE